jgi:hypothetical protein
MEFKLSVPRPDAELVGQITHTATDQGLKGQAEFGLAFSLFHRE